MTTKTTTPKTATTTAPTTAQAPEANPANAATSALPSLSSFDFSAFDTGLPIPAASTRAASEHDLPFVGVLDRMAPAAISGESPSLFVPLAYWLARGASAPVAEKAAYQKEKLRGQFRKWQKTDPQGRAGFSMVVATRPENDTAGTRFWLQYAMPSPAAPVAAAPEGHPVTLVA